MRNAHVRVLRTELATGYCTSACYQQKERPRILRVQVLYRQYWYTKPHPPLLFSSLISEEEAATAWVKNSEEKAFLARPARGGVRRRHPSPGYQPPRRGGSQLQKKLLYYSPQRSQYKNGGGPVHWRVCEQKCGHRRPSGLQNSKPGVVEASEQGGQSQTDIAPRTTNTATNVPTAVAVFFLAST